MGVDRVPSEFVWKVRAELVDELLRLGSGAGVSIEFDTSADPAGVGPEHYDRWRRGLREACFAVADPAIRGRMIALVVELQRRDRVDASLQRLNAQSDLERARQSWAWFVLACLLAVGSVWIGNRLGGMPGQIVGIACAALVAATMFRIRERFTDRAARKAGDRLATVIERSNTLAKRPPVFSAREAASGIVCPAFGALSAVEDDRVRAEYLLRLRLSRYSLR